MGLDHLAPVRFWFWLLVLGYLTYLNATAYTGELCFFPFDGKNPTPKLLTG